MIIGLTLPQENCRIRGTFGTDSDESSSALYHQLIGHFDLVELVAVDPDQPDNWHKSFNPNNRQARQIPTHTTEFAVSRSDCK